MYDCENVGSDHQFNEQNCTKHNLIEGNVFAHTASSGNHSPFAGIQYAGQEGLIRRNVFYHNIGPALDLTLYPEEARYNTGNRVGHNVFYQNHFCAIAFSGQRTKGDAFSDNEFKNNILLKNVFVRNDGRWEWYKELDGKPVQVLLGGLTGFTFERNLFFNDRPGESYLLVVGQRDSTSNPPPRNLAWWSSNQAAIVKGALEVDPRFTNPENHDFHLMPGSPAIDTGVFLTRTMNSGSGTTLPVLDARWFCDGYGIEGLEGDRIQMEGQEQSVSVTKVDYEKNVLTLAAPLQWRAGQGVTTAYVAKGPDLGAFEHGERERPLAPAAPSSAVLTGETSP